MAEKPANRKQSDFTSVRVDEEWEINYWTEELHCSEAELRAAIEIAGTSADELRIFLHGGKSARL